MKQVFYKYPDGACLYIAMEDLLKRKLRDEEWIAHIQEHKSTKGSYYREVLIPRYDCLILDKCQLYFHQNYKYNHILTEKGTVWLENKSRTIVCYKRQHVDIGHSVCIPYHALMATSDIFRVTIRNKDIYHIDNSESALNDYKVWKDKEDSTGKEST